MCYFPPDLPLTFNQPVSVTISSTKLILNGEEPLEIVLRVPWQYTQYVSMACVTTQIVVEEDDEADLHGQKGNGDNKSDSEDDNGEKDGADGSKKGAGGDDEDDRRTIRGVTVGGTTSGDEDAEEVVEGKVIANGDAKGGAAHGREKVADAVAHSPSVVVSS